MNIDRRTTLALLLGLAAASTTQSTQAAEPIDYTEESLAAAAAKGEPYLIDFFAWWCGTCAAQHRVLDRLSAANPAYAAIPVIRVDWDKHREGPLVAQMAIPRRSTLVMMRGTTELGRLVAETGEQAIAGLLDLASS